LSLLLFDIDGTLLLTAGAGMRGMTRAFEETFGVARAFEGIPPAGRTDTYLVSAALQRAGIANTAKAHARFRDAYVPALADEIGRPAAGRFGVMPGVEALLAALRDQSGWHLALLTGNYEPAAQIKLRHFSLDRFFEWGVYGEESSDRRELSRIALERARARDIPEASCAGAVVIGDTPDDVACAQAVGARSLAVATGPFSLDELTAAGAHTALVDLSDTAAVLKVLR
jgi:phosphoglycolate phosphatase-like HAD superfamily hydrolase